MSKRSSRWMSVAVMAWLAACGGSDGGGGQSSSGQDALDATQNDNVATVDPGQEGQAGDLGPDMLVPDTTVAETTPSEPVEPDVAGPDVAEATEEATEVEVATGPWCGSRVVRVSARTGHTCALTDDRQVWCWGGNGDGQIGNGNTDTQLLPLRVKQLSGVQDVAVGEKHSCALVDGMVWCWGSNHEGQLGIGLLDSQKDPTPVGDPKNVRDVVAGYNHTCAITQDGKLWCWGDNWKGQLGVGDDSASNRPVQVSGIDGVVHAAAGWAHTCAVRSDGTAWCWGANDGRLGNGASQTEYSPVQVQGLTDVTWVAAGEPHTCAVKKDGTVWCWGANAYGQLGTGSPGGTQFTPVQVTGLGAAAVQVAAGVSHTCALLQDGSVWCWGQNYYGQLGNGTNTDSGAPVQVQGLSDAVDVTVGSSFSCAVKKDGNVYCWGAGGNLGYGKTGNSNVPIAAICLP